MINNVSFNFTALLLYSTFFNEAELHTDQLRKAIREGIKQALQSSYSRLRLNVDCGGWFSYVELKVLKLSMKHRQ